MIPKQEAKSKKWFTLSKLMNGVMIIALIAIIVSPDVKVLMLKVVMKTGLFRPDISEVPISQQGEPVSNEDLKLLDRDGRQINIDAFNGKVIFLNFWATWCPPCRAEMPSINSLYQRFGKDSSVIFLMVDVDGEVTRSETFLSKYGYEFPLYIPAGSLPKRLFDGTLPTTVVLDKNGRVAMKHSGIADYSTASFMKFMEDLVKN
jgi:thiol-disulfide isomerase/thioredoxin